MINSYWIILAIKSRSFSQEVYLPFNGPTPNSGMFTVYKIVLIFHPCDIIPFERKISSSFSKRQPRNKMSHFKKI